MNLDRDFKKIIYEDDKFYYEVPLNNGNVAEISESVLNDSLMIFFREVPMIIYFNKYTFNKYTIIGASLTLYVDDLLITTIQIKR